MGIFVIGKPNIEKLKAKKDVDGLIKILKHKDRDIREEAALNIGKVGNKRAVESIKKCVIATDVEQVHGRGMIVLDEVFSLSKTKLKEEFLKSKA
ncbi:HEAT repeat domain-containing protein [bacterium]|nr:HEAT repeat domain-containing protein [bacterium]